MCGSVPRYPLSYQSPTLVAVNNNNTPFVVSYADGTGVFISQNLKALQTNLRLRGASGYVARETVQLANLTVASQAFGGEISSNLMPRILQYITAMITNSNLTFVDEISGIMGLGFPRLSSISNSVTNCTTNYISF